MPKPELEHYNLDTAIRPTRLEILRFIVEHADTIPIYAEVDGKRGRYMMTELPDEQLLEYMAKFVREGRLPHRILHREESHG